MRKPIASVPFIVLLWCVWGCGTPPQPSSGTSHVDIEAVSDELHGLLRTWVDAQNTGNVDQLASMWTDDAIRLPPNAPPLIGIEAIREDIEKEHSQFTFTGDETLADFHVVGDWVISRGSWSYKVYPRNGGDSYHEIGYMMDIYKRQPDGSLKLYWNAWTDEALVDPNLPQE